MTEHENIAVSHEDQQRLDMRQINLHGFANLCSTLGV